MWESGLRGWLEGTSEIWRVTPVCFQTSSPLPFAFSPYSLRKGNSFNIFRFSARPGFLEVLQISHYWGKAREKGGLGWVLVYECGLFVFVIDIKSWRQVLLMNRLSSVSSIQSNPILYYPNFYFYFSISKNNGVLYHPRIFSLYLPSPQRLHLSRSPQRMALLHHDWENCLDWCCQGLYPLPFSPNVDIFIYIYVHIYWRITTHSAWPSSPTTPP